jgi:hypothetical protein
VHEISNMAPLSRTSSKLGFVCEVCGTAFERYACWAKRHKVNSCGKACADEAKRIRVEKICVVCFKKFVTSPVMAARYVTCSRGCLAKNRAHLTSIGVLFPQQYREEIPAQPAEKS